MAGTYRTYADETTALREAEAMWQELCADRGVDPADIAAGTATLDSRRGVPVFPPVTTSTGFVIVPSRGTGAMILHKAAHEVWDGRQRTVGGTVVTLRTSADDAKPPDQLPQNMQDRLGELDDAGD